ncbi:MAG: hypothetical protein M3T56_14360 [Chloroflexota bacterium]|nr:hypothetical protein [Chloroflexota bacterium]
MPKTIPIYLGNERFDAPSEEMTGAELRRLFRLPADDLLYHAKGSKVEGSPIEDADNVELEKGDHFISVPRNITGGAANLTALPSVQREEIALIQDAYTGSEVVADGNEAGIVVPFISPRWEPETVHVLVKMPPLYPNQPPDLIFAEAGARPRDGSAVPRRMQEIAFAGRSWQQISWHFSGPYDPTRRNLLGFVHSIQRYLSSANP